MLSQKGGQTMFLYFFLWPKLIFLAKGGPWPNGPLKYATVDNARYKMLDKVCAPSEKPILNKCVFKCFEKVSGPIHRSLNSAGKVFTLFRHKDTQF